MTSTATLPRIDHYYADGEIDQPNTRHDHYYADDELTLTELTNRHDRTLHDADVHSSDLLAGLMYGSLR